MLLGTAQSHRAWLGAHAAREELRVRWAECLAGYDVLLLPVAPTAAPPHHEQDHDRWGRRLLVDGTDRSYWDQLKWCGVANIAGTPSTTFPVRIGAAGLPVGLQVMGAAGGDRTTIAVAALLARALGGIAPPPRFA